MSSSKKINNNSGSNSNSNKYKNNKINNNTNNNKGNNKNNNNNNNNNNSDSYYEEYLTDNEIPNLISLERLFIGRLYISASKRKLAYVKVDNLDIDIFISDEKDRNRSFIGDKVAVLLYPKDDWIKVSSSNLEDEIELIDNNKLTEITDVINDLWKPKTNLLIDGLKDNGNKSKKKQSSSVDTICKSENLQPRGKVVKIIESNHKTTLIGAITSPYQFKPNEKLPQNESRFYFQPSDLTYPNCILPRLELPNQFIENPYQYQNNIYVIDIDKDWSINSKFPFARNVRSLGEAGSIHTEIEATLIQNNVSSNVFSDEAMEPIKRLLSINDINGLTQHVEWQIPLDEINKRKDLRDYRIFTIDPPTAKDLDDAVHIQELADGTYSVGVHIADVSYFLEEDTALDLEARNRATSVYLVQKVIPMLPPILCEQLCSLNPNVDRLAFSCIFKMNQDGTLCDDKPWFGKTVIRSCAKLDYPTAQRMIDGVIPLTNNDDFLKNLSNDTWEDKRRPIGQDAYKLVKDVLLLHQLAVPRRQLRLNNGALVIQNSKLTFSLDHHGNPNNVSIYKIHDSNRLIEEYMLLANYLVAQELLLLVGRAAFLRKHSPPKLSDMTNIKLLCEKLNIAIDFKSITNISNTIKHLLLTCDNEIIKSIFNALLVQPMQLAKYIIANNESSTNWSHFGLSIPYYTHFTSPIRRYADVMVHRLLEKGLLLGEAIAKEQLTTDQYIDILTQIANNCNTKRETAKTVQERCDRIYLSVYIMSNPLDTEAIVIGIGSKSFSVLVLLYGITYRLFTDDIGVDTTFNESTNQLTLKRNSLNKNNSNYQSKNPSNNYTTFADSLIIELQKVLIVHVSARTMPPIDIIVSLVGPKYS